MTVDENASTASGNIKVVQVSHELPAETPASFDHKKE